MTGTQVRIEFRTGENPYEGKRNNLLTPRQEHKRKRLMDFVRKAKKRDKKITPSISGCGQT